MGKLRTEGILLLYHRPLFQKGASTIIENIGSFAEYSSFPVIEVNTDLGFPRYLKNIEFDVIVLHYSLFGRGATYELTIDFEDYLACNKDKCIVAFFQDEYRYCKKRFNFINDTNVSVIYTCVQDQYHGLVYGKYTKARKIVTCIPGYVSKSLPTVAKRFSKPFKSRKIDIGYRARRLEFYMGKEAQEKHLIGIRFRELTNTKQPQLITDINVEESGRFYGDNWYKFIGNCKSLLGVESGVSIFDLEDEVREGAQKILSKRPDISFEELFDLFLCKWENNVPLRTISPRHFEAAAFGTCQILFEGKYSGIMEADRHFIPLKKDYSNFDDVIDKLNDEKFTNYLIENGKRDLIQSRKYSYEGFILSFDKLLTDFGIKPSQTKNSNFKTAASLIQKDFHVRITKIIASKFKNRFFSL